MPPNPRYSWVLSEQCCSAAGVGGVSSSVWRPNLSGFIPPSVIDNGASSLPVSSMPLAGQSVSTETSDDPAIVQRDWLGRQFFLTFGFGCALTYPPEKLKNALPIITTSNASWQLWGIKSGSRHQALWTAMGSERGPSPGRPATTRMRREPTLL